MHHILKYKNIIFDDFERDENENENESNINYWSQICTDCLNKYQFSNELDSSSPFNSICGIKDCEKIAECYIDFGNNIEII